MIVSFDFDGCLATDGGSEPNHHMIEIAQMHSKAGDKVVIVSFRNPKHENDSWIQQYMPHRVAIPEFLKIHKIPIKDIYYTNHDPKKEILHRIGSQLHYDDDPEVIAEIGDMGKLVPTFKGKHGKS